MTEAGLDCIAIQSLGHDTALGRGAERPAGRVGARRQALGSAGGRAAGAQAARRAGTWRHETSGARAGRRRRRAAGPGLQAGVRACWASRHRRGRRGRRAGKRWAQAWARGPRGPRGLGVLVRMVGWLAGSAGPVWVLVNLA